MVDEEYPQFDKALPRIFLAHGTRLGLLEPCESHDGLPLAELLGGKVYRIFRPRPITLRTGTEMVLSSSCDTAKIREELLCHFEVRLEVTRLLSVVEGASAPKALDLRRLEAT